MCRAVWIRWRRNASLTTDLNAATAMILLSFRDFAYAKNLWIYVLANMASSGNKTRVWRWNFDFRRENVVILNSFLMGVLFRFKEIFLIISFYCLTSFIFMQHSSINQFVLSLRFVLNLINFGIFLNYLLFYRILFPI